MTAHPKIRSSKLSRFNNFVKSCFCTFGVQIDLSQEVVPLQRRGDQVGDQGRAVGQVEDGGGVEVGENQHLKVGNPGSKYLTGRITLKT